MAEIRLDTPYNWRFFNELSPQFLNYVCTLNGHPAPPLADGFSYCDLGCGNGATINGLAHLFPQGRFTAIDGDGDNIRNAALLAGDNAPANLNLLEISFAQLAKTELPQFDFVVLNGVISRIDAEARACIREFLKLNVKPGGVVYVSYNAMPGWSAILPLIDMMHQLTAELPDDAAFKAQAGLDLMRMLNNNNAGFFSQNSTAKAFVEDMERHSLNHIADEIFSSPTEAFYFHHINAELTGAGFTYSGNALLNLNFADIAVPSAFGDILRKAGSRLRFEASGDLIRNQNYRKDIYVKGGGALNAAEQLSILSHIPFGATCTADQFDRAVTFGEVELKFEADIFHLLIEYLSEGAKTVEDLKDLDVFSSFETDMMVDAIKFLTTGGQLTPFVNRTVPPSDRALNSDQYQLKNAFNLNMLKLRLLAQPTLAMISPGAGIGVELAMSDALYALCSVEAPRDQVADWVVQRLAEDGQQTGIAGASETKAIAEALELFRTTRLPKLLELGILAPAG